MFLGHIFVVVIFAHYRCYEHEHWSYSSEADALLLSEKSKSIFNLKQFESAALNPKCVFVPVKDE